MYTRFLVKYTLFLSDFNATGPFSVYFEKNIPLSNFMKIRAVGAEFYAEARKGGQRGRDDEDNRRL